MKYYHLLIAVIVFVAADRALSTITPPFYRAHADHERIINEYHTRQFQGAAARRASIRSVVLGDSRARYGVDPAYLTLGDLGPAYNLAVDGAGVQTVEYMLPDLRERLPQLRQVFWGVSPRVFNLAWKDNAVKRLQASPGYARWRGDCPRFGLSCSAGRAFDDTISLLSRSYAQRSILQPLLLDRLVPLQDKPARFTALEPVAMSDLGYMPLPGRATLDTGEPTRVKAYRRAHARGWFKWNEPIYRRFEQLLTQSWPDALRVVLFIPPMHHSFTTLPTADHDVTPDDAYAEVVQRLQKLAIQYTHISFVDLNRDGANGFQDEHWGNFDHLNAAGARILSAQLAEFANDDS